MPDVVNKTSQKNTWFIKIILVILMEKSERGRPFSTFSNEGMRQVLFGTLTPWEEKNGYGSAHCLLPRECHS